MLGTFTMIRISEKLTDRPAHDATLTLPFELRQKSRFKATLDDGRPAGVVLPRGGILRHGDCLRTDQGLVIAVQAAPESVSTAFTRDSLALAEACYHLGNRHIALQIGDSWLRYLHDHVLDRMLGELGLRVFHELAPFEPVGGAYGDGAHAHGHLHHDHGHATVHHDH